MFKILVKNLNDNPHYTKKETLPYVIRYELIPEYNPKLPLPLIHQAEFSSLKKAEKFSIHLSRYFTEVHFLTEMIYNNINQNVFCMSSKSLNKDKLYRAFSIVSNLRFSLLEQSQKTDYAHQHILLISQYIEHLKAFQVILHKYSPEFSSELFSLLVKLQVSFTSTYRSSYQLYQNNQLQLFAL